MSETGYETPEYWEGVYAAPAEWPVDPLLPQVVADLTPGTALDVGCGEGQNSWYLADQGWSVLGIDFAPTAIARARDGAPAEARFAVADARSWTPEAPFDLVISTYALGSRRHEMLPMMANAVSPGGTAYIAEFDVSTRDLWPDEDLVSVDELVGAFAGFHIERAEVLPLLHYHDDHAEEWPMAILVAQRPVR